MLRNLGPSELHLSFIPERPVLCVSANGIIYTESGSSAIADVTIAAMAIDTIISFGFILLGGGNCYNVGVILFILPSSSNSILSMHTSLWNPAFLPIVTASGNLNRW